MKQTDSYHIYHIHQLPTAEGLASFRFHLDIFRLQTCGTLACAVFQWPWRIVLVRPKKPLFSSFFSTHISLPKKVFSYFFIPFPLASSNVVYMCPDLTQIRPQGHSGKSSLLAQTYQTYQVPLCTAKTAHLDPFGTPESRSPTFCLRFKCGIEISVSESRRVSQVTSRTGRVCRTWEFLAEAADWFQPNGPLHGRWDLGRWILHHSVDSGMQHCT